jgi:hypothetical protein
MHKSNMTCLSSTKIKWVGAYSCESSAFVQDSYPILDSCSQIVGLRKAFPSTPSAPDSGPIGASEQTPSGIGSGKKIEERGETHAWIAERRRVDTFTGLPCGACVSHRSEAYLLSLSALFFRLCVSLCVCLSIRLSLCLALSALLACLPCLPCLPARTRPQDSL